MAEKEEPVRCAWALGSEGERLYHDREWGRPCCDDRGQFEFLVLESAQAGLSWRTILNRREGYRRAFAGFDPARVAGFGPEKAEELLADASIIRNRKKIESAISNARVFLETAAQYGSFSRYIWGFVDGRPIANRWRTMSEVPPQTPLAQKIAKDLKARGFRFLGPTIIYSHLQATGLVNDHLTNCFVYEEIRSLGEKGVRL